MTLRRAAALVAFAGLAAACDGYPDDWSGIDGRVAAIAGRECPDLRGTWQLHPARGGRPYAQSVIERHVGNRDRQRWHWETITIAGDADDSLSLTLRRSAETVARYEAYATEQGEYFARQYATLSSPERRWQDRFGWMDDDAYAANLAQMTIQPESRVTLRRDAQYTCDGGWLIGERLVRDPGPDPSRPRPDTVIGVVRIARLTSGHLAFNAVFDEAKEFGIWCGDGCRGFPLGTWETNEWSRLDPTEAPPTVSVSRPWSAPFRTAEVAVSQTGRMPAQTADEIRAALERVLPSDVELIEVRRDASRYRARIASAAGRAPFHRALETMPRADSVRSIEVVALDSLGAGRWELAVRLGVATRIPSAAETDAFEQRVRALLAPHGAWGSSRRSGGVLTVHMTFESQPRYLAAVNALRRDPGIEFDVAEAGQVGRQVRVVLLLRERPAT